MKKLFHRFINALAIEGFICFWCWRCTCLGPGYLRQYVGSICVDCYHDRFVDRAGHHR